MNYGQNYDQSYGQQPNYNQQQNYGQPQYGYEQSQYTQQPYQNTIPSGSFKLATDKELYCKATGSGMFFAKKGSMVGFDGDFKFSKRLLGTNGGNLASQVVGHLARKVTGENLEVMEVNGSGICYLADNAQHVTVIDLEANGPWSKLTTESENLLAFTPNCHYGVTSMGVTGTVSQKGMFSSCLTYNGPGAQVAIMTNGNPMVFQVKQGGQIVVDPDCHVAHTGANPHLKTDINLKTLIGQSSGESYSLVFNEPGQFVVIQPYERESGFALKDTNRPTTQSKPSFGGGGNSGMMNGNVTKDLGSVAGDLIGGFFK